MARSTNTGADKHAVKKPAANQKPAAKKSTAVKNSEKNTEQKEQAALAQKLKNGLTTYRNLLGPDWRSKFRDLAEEQDEARKLGLHLPTMETASGATVAGKDTKD